MDVEMIRFEQPTLLIVSEILRRDGDSNVEPSHC